MIISVLICTYNRHLLLANALKSLTVQSLEKSDQIVIVNGGDERTDQLVDQWKQSVDCEVLLIKVKNKNLANSRNIGLRHCTGDIIAMTDDDAVVFPDWVTRIKNSHLAHPEAGAIGGLVLGTGNNLISKVADVITFPTWEEPRYVRTLPGVNISYKRIAVEQVGDQDEILFRGEDVDFNWRIQNLGYKIYFDPSIKVHHYHRSTLRGLLNQHYMYGRAYFLVRRKWPEMYCIYPHRLSRIRDVLKLVNFFASLFYQPILSMRKVPGFLNQTLSIPILFLAGFAWRQGMIVQGIKEHRQRGVDRN